MSVAMTRSDVWDRYPSTIEVTICFQMQESGLKPLSWKIGSFIKPEGDVAQS